MICFEAHISDLVLDFFQKNRSFLLNVTEINKIIKSISGINNFFLSQEDSLELLEKIEQQIGIISEPNRREYGDFQTNSDLASKVVEYTFSKSSDIEFILEPTCGKGSFILASIKRLKSIKKIVGIEIYQPYVWETKFSILSHFLTTKDTVKPQIDIIHGNIFDFDFSNLAKRTRDLKTLIIGNPPWVTNSELGSINSKNLPKKSNFKKYSGIEAMTGKGNFDIGEYIALILLKYFQNHQGIFTFLIKNSVAKNLIHDQKQNKFRINHIEKLNIDSKKEFNVSVNACLFLTQLNSKPAIICTEFDFYTQNYVTSFGWQEEKFVYSIEDYDNAKIVEGKSAFIWRSGVKHDCSKIMELEQVNGHFVNGLGEEIKLENKLIFGLLKSSDLKTKKVNNYRKLTIITQKKIGQDTKYIQDTLPLTYQYLNQNREFFDKRKSSIYKDKPDFSIFGIGDYSFAKYKIAISGLYKSTHFTLVNPQEPKSIMLDDTCYFIGFNDLKVAKITHYLLNSELVQKFLKSIIFSDSKRPINKEILMRIDLKKAYDNNDFEKAKDEIPNLKIEYWENFNNVFQENEQLSLF